LTGDYIVTENKQLHPELSEFQLVLFC